MRVRLLTYHFSDNYGALFQAYALREWFLRRGVDAQFINYHPRYVEEGGRFDRLLNPGKWRKNLTIAYLKASHMHWSVFGSCEQSVAFEGFRRDYLGVDGPRLFDAAEIGAAGRADLLVCGSDQIWNPSVQKGLDPVYFLDFEESDRARRISYAPSFGRSSLGTQFHAQARRLISRLDAISVREHSGVDVVRAVSGREAVCAPDPTILLGDFQELLQSVTPSGGKHVFCYALRTSQVIRGVAEHVAKVERLELISSRSMRQRWWAIGTGITPGPAEWLRLLNEAVIVVTNSFHGVVLSIVLNRPFVAVALPGKRGALNERAFNILKYTGLLERVVGTEDPADIDRVIARPIDWADVNKQISELQKVGSRFLLDQMAHCGLQGMEEAK